jgi:hypothetical protein
VAGCASLIEWRENGAGMADDATQQIHSLRTNRHLLFGMAAQRSFSVCREALSRMRQTWKGVSWLCSTLESRAAQEADVNLAEEGTAKVSMRDAGYVKRVREMAESEGTDDEIQGRWAEYSECKWPLRRVHRPRPSIDRSTVVAAVLGLTVSGNTDEPPGMLSLLQVGYSHADDDQSPDQYSAELAVTNSQRHLMDGNGPVVDDGGDGAHSRRMGATASTVAAETAVTSVFEWERGRGGNGQDSDHDEDKRAPDLVTVPFPFSVAQSSLSLLDAIPEGGSTASQQLWGLDPQVTGNVSIADWLGLQLLPATATMATATATAPPHP